MTFPVEYPKDFYEKDKLQYQDSYPLIPILNWLPTDSKTQKCAYFSMAVLVGAYLAKVGLVIATYIAVIRQGTKTNMANIQALWLNRLSTWSNYAQNGANAAIFVLIVCFVKGYFVFDKKYEDFNFRRKESSSLKSGWTNLENFITKHGWENIKKWGFNVHPGAYPLAKPEDLEKRLLSELKFCCACSKMNAIGKKGVMWALFEQGLVSDRAKERIEKVISNCLQLVRTRIKKQIVEVLFENRKELEKYGFDHTPFMKFAIKWVKAHENEYVQDQEIIKKLDEQFISDYNEQFLKNEGGENGRT
jgi:hypothetical protein